MNNEIKIKTIKKGDFFAFKIVQNEYRVIFCDEINVSKSPFNCNFGVVYESFNFLPTKNNIQNSNFIGVISGNKLEYIKQNEVELSIIWKFYPDIKPKTLGAYSILCYGKELKELKNNLIYIGNINVISGLIYNGNSSIYPGTLENYFKFFKSVDEIIIQNGLMKLPIKSISKE